MSDLITPDEIARLRELLDAATSGGRGWRAVMRGDEWRIRAPHPAASSCEPSLDCENNVKAIVEVFNAIHPLIDQLAAQAAEIERLNKGFHESCIAREEAANARAKKAQARVAELEGLLRKHAALACGACMGTGSYIGDEDRDGPCDACGGTRHVLPEDVAAVLAGREGGR